MIVLFLIIFILGLIYYKYFWIEEFVKVKMDEIKVDDNTLFTIREILRATNTIFNNYKIQYWADCGTLLGMVRHGDIIPWDDDGDISIFKEDEEQFLYLRPVFEQYGYGIGKWWGGYKIFPLNGQVSNEIKEGSEYFYRYPFVDVFIMEHDKEKNIVMYSDKGLVKRWPKEYHNYDKLFPLQSYKFHDFYLWGPRDCSDYLQRTYGPDWRDVAYLQYDHKNGKHFKRQKFKIKDIM
jgi:phosphorylcholine metabolism protein LicD